MGLPNGVHHLALTTGNMKAQIEFFTDVLGAELKALYWMHGAVGFCHGFVKLNDLSYVAFVQGPEGAKPAEAGGPAIAGAMQHVALSVPTEEDLLALRDRIRSRGIVVVGPLDHGFCRSIYFGGPENLRLEVATNPVGGIDERAWIDPEVVAKFAIDEADLARYKAPAAFEDSAGGVKQPPLDPAKPQPMWRPAVLDRILTMSDEEVRRTMSDTEPPVTVPPRRAPAMAD